MKNYKPNSLFRGGEKIHLNACIGTNGGPYDYWVFSRGYFNSAFILSDSIISEERASPFIDNLVYPIVANFRHGFELGIKHCIIIAARIADIPPEYSKKHLLLEDFDRLRRISDDIDRDLIEQSDWNFVRNVIKDFSRTDPTGMVFRYPEDLSNELLIDAPELLNLETLAVAMKKCHKILDRLEIQLIQVADRQGKSIHSIESPLQ